jgi:transposase-like protein
MQTCPRGQSDRLIKNGSVTDKPKKLCKACGYQFPRMTPRGKPFTTKVNAVLWYLSGVSMNRIAFLFQVSAQSILNWVRAFAKASYEKPAPAGKIIVLELDEMWLVNWAKLRRILGRMLGNQRECWEWARPSSVSPPRKRSVLYTFWKLGARPGDAASPGFGFPLERSRAPS